MNLALNLEIEKPEESLLYKKGYSNLTHRLLILGDLVFLNLSFLLAYIVRFQENPAHHVHDHFLTLLFVCNLAWIVNVYFFNIYAISRVSKWDSIIWNIIKAVVFHALTISFFVLSIKGYYYSRLFFVINYGILIFFLFSWRAAFVIYIKKIRKTGYNTRNVIIVGANKASFKIYNYFLQDKSQGFYLKAVFTDAIDAPNAKANILPESTLLEYLKQEKVDEMYCALPLSEVTKIRELMSYAENHLIRFRYVPDFRALLYKKVDIEFYGEVPVLSVRKEPLENVNKRFSKRTFDIVFSLGVILFIMPILLPIVAILIKLQSKGPVFFKQLRSGRDNNVFYCYKFRTMVVNQNSDAVQATKNDSRVTPIGKFLRKTNLDEFPQFFNVLKGEMSIIGPRPHMVKHTEEFQESVDKFMVRHFVKPGITGWAQVNGFRGTTETPQKIIKRARYDVWYIENWSMQLDVKIVFLTVFNMLKGEKNAF